MYLGLPVRTGKESGLFDLEYIRIINKENHGKYLQNLTKIHENSHLDDSEIVLIGNDIEKEAVKSSLNNFGNLLKEHDFSEKYLKTPDTINKSPTINDNPVVFHHSFLGRRIHIFQTDFDNIPKMANLKDFTILTNPPYGYRSRSHISFTNLKGTYTRFKNLLRRNLQTLDQVYVLYPLDKRNPGSLLKIPGLAWSLIEKFDNGGIEIGLFQLDKELTSEMRRKEETQMIVLNERMLVETKEKEDAKALQVFQQSPEEKERRKKEMWKKEDKFMVEAKEWSKKLKFPREVTKTPKKLRRILFRKEKEYVRRKFHKQFVQARSLREEQLEESNENKIRNIKRKQANALISSLLDDDNIKTNNEEIMEKLQVELKKKADKRAKKKEVEEKGKEKKTRSSKW